MRKCFLCGQFDSGVVYACNTTGGHQWHQEPSVDPANIEIRLNAHEKSLLARDVQIQAKDAEIEKLKEQVVQLADRVCNQDIHHSDHHERELALESHAQALAEALGKVKLNIGFGGRENIEAALKTINDTVTAFRKDFPK